MTDPHTPQTWFERGVALQAAGRLDEAARALNEAVKRKPDFAQAWVRLGECVVDANPAAAADCFARAVQLDPSDVAAVFNLGVALELQGRAADAIAVYQRAQQLRPRDATRALIATRLPVVYDSREELIAWRERLERNLAQLAREGFRLDVERIPPPGLFFLAYQGFNDRDVMRTLGQMIVAPQPALPPVDRERADGRIRVGFISSYFYDHTIGRMNRGLIENLSRETFHVTVLSLGRRHGALAERIRAAADVYVELPPRSLPDARRLIVEQRLDVLLYTDIGMENVTYALSFSRLAPVQVVTWGHPSTTGSPQVDYYLSADVLESDGADEHYTERLVRPKDLTVYYDRPLLPSPLKPRAAFGLRDDDHVYGCLQSLFKLHPDFDPILDDILRRDERGILLLPRGNTPAWDEKLLARLRRTMPTTVGRVRLIDKQPYPDYLNLTVLCDALLAPIHFGAGNTSYEAFAFGVPTVTMPTEFLKGRITYGLYKAMGVTDCVASSPAEYADIAVRLGTDRAFRNHVRDKILAANHVLYGNRAGVRALEAFLRDAVASASSRS